MKEIYNGETVALGGVNLVTKQVVVDDSTGEKAKFTYDKTTGAVTVLDTVDPDSINPVTARAVATAVAGASGEIPVIGDGDNGKVLKAVVDGSSKSVEWGEAPSGIPDMTGKDGKILGAVDNGGTMEAQWINKPESNVTTSTKQFVVGVNGTGMPITVDCANASESTSPGTVEVAGVAGRNNMMNMDGVFFAVNGIDPNNTITITFPEDLGNASATGGFIQYVAWYQGAPGAITNLQASLSLSPTNQDGNVLKAGTYTVTGSAPSFTPDGVGLFYQGGGDAATQIIADITAAAPTLTLSTTASVVTGYSIKPSVLPSSAVGDAGKVLTVDAQGAPAWALYFTKEALTADATNNVFKTRLMYKSQFFIVLRAIDNSASPRNMVPLVKGSNDAMPKPLSMISNGDGVSVGVGVNGAQAKMEISFLDTATNTVIPVSDLTIDYCYMVVLGNQT